MRRLTLNLRSGKFLLKGIAFVATTMLLFNGCKKDIGEIANHHGHGKNNHALDTIVADTLPCGNFRTQTQGGWGSVPKGNNPGTYLHANFAGAFPNGLTVGCNDTIHFTSAQAITDYLPDGGTAAVLTQSYIDPTGLNNVLASQIIALTLSVQFDAYDPNFGGSSVSLGSLVIGSGVFAGLTVQAVLDEANKVLGGCVSTYTPSQMVDVLSSINQNFVDGKSNDGFLTCPGTTEDPDGGPDAG